MARREGNPINLASWRRLWNKPLVIFVGWTLLGLFFSIEDLVNYPAEKPPMSWTRVVSAELTDAYSWAALTPLIVWLARRLSLERLGAIRWTAIHFAAGIGAAVLHPFLQGMLFWVATARAEPLMTILVKRSHSIFYDFSMGFIMYGLILMATHAFDYQRRSREGDLRASRLEAQLAQAKLSALKMQLHPHFLFNTLHSLSALLHEDPEAADLMIARLGDFLRLTLEQPGTQEVSLEQELEFLDCYLDIELMRFRDRLTVRKQIAPETLAARVPNLILQPIVENAIRHGIAPRLTPGAIRIDACREQGRLCIQVCDDGPGVSVVKEGIGLRNTRARLRALYGAAQSLELANAPGGGLVVRLEVPFHDDDASHDAPRPDSR